MSQPAPMPPSIRAGRSEDADVVADFNALLAWETEGVRLDADTLARGVAAALSDPGKALYFVAEFGGRVVGQLMVTREWSDWRDGDIWWVQSVYVRADSRGRGVFRALYDHARDQAKAHGAVGLRLYVAGHNAAAQKVYERLGMTASNYRVMQEMFG